MTLVLNGTTGVSSVDGSASTPAVQGADSNTGVFFPAADTVAIATGGTEAVRVDSSRNVGIGTSTPSSFEGGIKTVVGNGGTAPSVTLYSSTTSYGGLYFADGTTGNEKYRGFIEYDHASDALRLGAAGATRSTIDSSGNLLVAGTSSNALGVPSVEVGGANGNGLITVRRSTTSSASQVVFYNPNGLVGQISTSGSSTTYATSSDYRLKHDIQPMTGALAKVAALKPCTYKWKVDGSGGEGFIAHELAEVVPQCVTGEKDAVDADGNPVYQGIDTSFLVATLTAAIQEQQALIESLTARIAALEAA